MLLSAEAHAFETKPLWNRIEDDVIRYGQDLF